MTKLRARGTIAPLFAALLVWGIPMLLYGEDAGGGTRAPADPPSIVGTVRDTAGQPLPAAQVVIARLNRTTTTDAAGRFEFRALRPGAYHLDAALIGYAPGHQDVVVPTEGSATVELTLRVTALQLAGIQVTASPSGGDVLSATQATSEVSGAELQRRMSSTVAQTLESQPGMAVRYAGPASSVPVIRGLTGERILVLQNGDRTADLSAASPDHALTIDPLAASRIEVVRGPASLLYGNNALGGVVNVITNAAPSVVPTHVSGYVATQGEMVAPGGAGSAALVVPLGSSLALDLQGGGRHLDDVRVGGGDVQGNTYSRDWHGSAAIGLIQPGFSAGASGRSYGFTYGLPADPGSGEAGVHIEGSRRDADVRFELPLGDRAIRDVRLHGTGQWYHHDEIEADGAIGTTFRLRTQTAEVRSRTTLGPLSGEIGAQALLHQYESTGEEALTPSANSNSYGIFFFQQLPLVSAAAEDARVPKLEVGGRYDRYETRSQAADPKFGPARSVAVGSFSGSLGLNVPLGPSASLGLSVARAFRAPTVEELFSNAIHAAIGAYQRGNPGLTAENNAGIDAIVRAQGRRVSGQISGYYNRINDYIAPIIVGDTTVDGATLPLDVFGQANARIYGIEGKVEAEVVRDVVLGVLGDALHGDFIDGGPLPYMPAARLGGSARWDTGRYSVSAEARHSFAQTRVSPNETATGSYTLLDVSAGANLVLGGRVHNITLRIDNALDARYAEATSQIKDFALNPGRNVSLVYRVIF